MALDRVIDAVRQAPNGAKPALLAELEKAPCKTPEVCGLKSLCLAGYEKHLAALKATARSRALLATPGAGYQAYDEAAQELGLAEAILVESKSLTARCVTNQGELRRRAQAH